MLPKYNTKPVHLQYLNNNNKLQYNESIFMDFFFIQSNIQKFKFYFPAPGIMFFFQFSFYFIMKYKNTQFKHVGVARINFDCSML